ncbi:MAG TPA: hypothetical protein VH370_15620 [Humisphaera sp.]|jgi:hypothetical protein|nr:hypothetical protein [Humisphaera sp.]
MKPTVWASLSVILAVAFCADVCRAEEVVLGGAVVTIPAGWKQAAKDGTVVLTPSDLGPGVACNFTLLGGVPFDGSLKEQFAVEWKALEALGTMVSENDASLQAMSGGVEIAVRSGRIDNADKPSAFVLMFIGRANGRIERMIFVANSIDAFQKYADAAGQIISHTRYVAPKPLAALEGVCMGFSQVKTDTRLECWLFLPNGVVYRGFPFGGPAHFSIEDQRKRRTGDIGEYRVEGDELVATFKSEKDPTRFSKSSDTWAAPVTRSFADRYSGAHGNTIASWTDAVATTLRLTRADACNGLKLSATFRLDAIALRFEPKPIPSIKFTADGEFSEDGLIRAIDPGTLKEGGGVEASKMPADGGRGKYAIDKNTLTLTYEDGAKLSLTFLVSDTELAKSTPGTVYVHQSKLLLVE